MFHLTFHPSSSRLITDFLINFSSPYWCSRYGSLDRFIWEQNSFSLFLSAIIYLLSTKQKQGTEGEEDTHLSLFHQRSRCAKTASGDPRTVYGFCATAVQASISQRFCFDRREREKELGWNIVTSLFPLTQPLCHHWETGNCFCLLSSHPPVACISLPFAFLLRKIRPSFSSFSCSRDCNEGLCKNPCLMYPFLMVRVFNCTQLSNIHQ